MSPLSTPCASTTGSFSIRCWPRIRSASSSVVPTGAVTSFSLRHRLADRLVEIALELQIAVGDDADEPALSVHDRHAGDLEPPHERVRLAQRTVGAERDRVEDHSALAALDPVDFGGLAVGRHVLVQDADSAGPGHRHGHLRLGDGVHGSGNERNIEGDVTSKVAGGRNFAGMDRGVSRDQEDVVEGQAGLGADDGHIRDGPPWPLRALGRPVASCSITKIRAWVRGTQAAVPSCAVKPARACARSGTPVCRWLR